jgi:hypothetical protein
MVDRKITLVSDITTLASTDVIPVGRPGNTTAYKATMTEVGAFASAYVTDNLTLLDNDLTIGANGDAARQIVLQNHKTGDIPFRIYTTNATFLGVEESILGIGYNAGGEAAGKHKLFMAFETDYQYGAGTYAAEWYVQINNTLNNASVRPFFTTVDRDTLVGSNYYSATVHYFTNVAGATVMEIDNSGSPSTFWLDGTTVLSHATNNVRFLKQVNNVGASVSLLWLDNTNVVCLGQGGYKINPQDDMVFYPNTLGPIVTDRSDGHLYRIKVTNGVLGTEVYM